MKIRISVFLLSLMLLGAVAAAIFKSVDEEWSVRGNDYLAAAKTKAKDPSVKEALAGASAEILQDKLDGYPGVHRVDRCRTCHAAIDDPNFVDGQNPMKTHPKLEAPHPSSKFGCTVCHEGDGRALDTLHAHGHDEFAHQPLLTGKYIEANCVQCHTNLDKAQVPTYARGRVLFEKTGCVGCHTIEGFSKGKLGPELTMAGEKFHLPYLRESVEQPKANDVTSIMPRFHLSKEDVTALVVFLKSLRGKPLGTDATSYKLMLGDWKKSVPQEVPVTRAQGQKSIDERGCVSCHRLNGKDGRLAPNLGWEGLHRDAEYIVQHLTDPRQHAYGSNMPNFEMSKSEKEAIALYLTSLKKVAVPATPKAQYQKFCTRCHGKNGDAKSTIGHNLLPKPRRFINAKFFNWLPDERVFTSIAESVPGTAMPPFKNILTKQQIVALFAYVRATFIKKPRPAVKPRHIPQRNPVAVNEASLARGKATFEKRCYGCHGKLGDGNGPNAQEMLPRPRNLTSTVFFERVTDRRMFESITYGIVGTGMPSWDVLTEEQRWELINYIRQLSNTKNH